MYNAEQVVVQSLIASYGEPQVALSQIHSGVFRNYVESLVAELRLLCSEPDVIGLSREGLAKIERFQKANSPIVGGVVILDDELRIVYAYPTDPSLIGRDLSEFEHNRKALATKQPVLGKPFTAVQGFEAVPIVYPLLEGRTLVGFLTVLLRTRRLAEAFWAPVLGSESYVAFLDDDGSSFWKISFPQESIEEPSEFTSEDWEGIRAKIRETKGILPVLYHGRLPGLNGKWFAGIAPFKVLDKKWFLVTAVPDAPLRLSIRNYQLMLLTLGVVVLVILGASVSALLKSQRDSSIAKERARLAEEFERKLNERTSELAKAKEELDSYAKNLETEVAERTRKLARSEEMYRQLVDNVGTIIFILRGAKLAFVNQAFLGAWEVKRDAKDWLGKDLIRMVSAKQRPQVLNALAQIENATDIVRFTELEVQESEHKTRIWDGALKKVKLEDRHLVIGFFNDITDKKVLERQVLQAQKLESIGRIAGGIAHDFNNILAAIFGHLALLREQVGENPGGEVVELINTIEGASKRAAELTKKLLLFTRRSEEEHRPVDIVKSLDDVAALLRPSLTPGVTLEIKKPEGSLIALADATEVQQVLMNLCINAIEAMPDGGKLTVSASRISARDDPELSAQEDPEKTFVRIRVADTGHGIDPSILPQIFEPFFTTKEAGKGSGLGLSIAYHIARKHNGYLTVDSDWGRGSVFSLYLPEQVREFEEGVKPARYEFPSFAGSPPVLVADDEVLITDSARRFFERLGLKMLVANDGVEAIEVFKKHQHEIPLVVLDYRMPRMNGVQAFALIKKLNPATVGVLMSGLGEDVGQIEFQMSGFQEFLKKPFTFEELSRIFEKYLKQQKAPKEVPFFG